MRCIGDTPMTLHKVAVGQAKPASRATSPASPQAAMTAITPTL
jgi:hypothetical protein